MEALYKPPMLHVADMFDELEKAGASRDRIFVDLPRAIQDRAIVLIDEHIAPAAGFDVVTAAVDLIESLRDRRMPTGWQTWRYMKLVRASRANFEQVFSSILTAAVPDQPRKASDALIRQTLHVVWADAEGRGLPPYNVRNVIAPTLKRLAAKGASASGNYITKIAGEPEFARYRGPPGVKHRKH